MTDKVVGFLKDLDDNHRHKEIFKAMVFPDTEKMRERKDDALVQTKYTCAGNMCNFAECLVDINNSDKLLKWRTRDMCVEIVEDIEIHQDDYLPAQLDGFYINRMGYELVHMKRSDSTGKGITGFVEYNDLRRKSMEYYDTKKLARIIEAVANNNNKSNCIIA